MRDSSNVEFALTSSKANLRKLQDVLVRPIWGEQALHLGPVCAPDSDVL
jgi:hypothetical protein